MKKILFSLLTLILLNGCASCGFSWNCNNLEGMAKYYAKVEECKKKQLESATKYIPYSRDIHMNIINNCIISNGKYQWTNEENIP